MTIASYPWRGSVHLRMVPTAGEMKDQEIKYGFQFKSALYEVKRSLFSRRVNKR
jgi:hypothetical protein